MGTDIALSFLSGASYRGFQATSDLIEDPVDRPDREVATEKEKA